MALVPFSVSGAASRQDLEERLLQVGPHSLLLRQRPAASGNTTHLRSTQDEARGKDSAVTVVAPHHQPDLSNVGLVLWESGYVLADFLLLRLAAAQGAVSTSGWCGSTGCGCWAGVRVLELGCGGGTVGMFMALAGAEVVLTDQHHILPLTQENLALNFPATATHNQQFSSHTPCGTFGQPAQTTKPLQRPPSTQPAGSQEPVPASDPFTAAFGPQGVAAAQALQQQQASCAQAMARSVFSCGPLVVQYSWGEPLQLLQERVVAAAAARLAVQQAVQHSPSSRPDYLRQVVEEAQELPSQHGGGVGAVQQQGHIDSTGIRPAPAAAVDADGEAHANAAGIAASSTSKADVAGALQLIPSHGYDVVVGADLLYDPALHGALLQSLAQLAAASPHLQVFLCWRCRGLGEEAFLVAAGGAGWLVDEVPPCALHPEYQTGCYRLVRLVRLP